MIELIPPLDNEGLIVNKDLAFETDNFYVRVLYQQDSGEAFISVASKQGASETGKFLEWTSPADVYGQIDGGVVFRSPQGSELDIEVFIGPGDHLLLCLADTHSGKKLQEPGMLVPVILGHNFAPGVKGIILGDSVNIRSQPNVQAEVISSVDKGTIVQTTNKYENTEDRHFWYEINIPGSSTEKGWVRGDYINAAG